MVRTENGKTLKVQGKGRVEFTDDDSDVKSLEPGGRFSFETANGWFSGFSASRFEATAARDGSITRTYTIDGKNVSDDEGRKWLAATLPDLVRDLAIGADTRVKRILATAGEMSARISAAASAWRASKSEAIVPDRSAYAVPLVSSSGNRSAAFFRTAARSKSESSSGPAAFSVRVRVAESRFAWSSSCTK